MKTEPLREALPQYISPLNYVCNLSLHQGVFPDEMKIANVIPLYKKDDSMVFSNYRPVSLLCSLSKVFEKIMYNRLLAFLEKYKIIYRYQFGFRKYHSTYLAVMALIDRIIKCLEDGDHIVGVFLDFSKAFDTVDHSILLKKLHYYGVRDNAYDWFNSYLNNRKQYVSYNDVTSSMKSIKCGVPQGSILGPIIFLIYINDLHCVCSDVFSIFFADYSNIFKNGKNLLEIQKVMNDVDIKIDDCSLTQVHSSKFLGVIIDDRLTWKDHITYVSKKVSKGIGIIRKARRYLKNETLLSLYYSFVYPYLTYCNQIWGNLSSYSLKRLIVLQKRVVRIIS